MASFFDRLLGRRDKPQSIKVQPAVAPGDLPSGRGLNELLGRVGTPESYAGLYEKEAFQPERAQAMSELTRTTIPGIKEAFASRGLGRSAGDQMATGTEAQAYGDVARQLALRRGQLRTQGLERGFQQQGTKVSALQQLLGQEIGQTNLGQQRQTSEDVRIQGLQQAREDAMQQGIGRTLEFGSNLFGGSALKNLLKKKTSVPSFGAPTGASAALNFGRA